MIELQLLFGLLGAMCFGLVLFAARLASDVRLWRDASLEYRNLWKWERERADWLRKELAEERKRHQEGPYR